MHVDNPQGHLSSRRISRRDFVKAAGMSGVATGLAGCTALGSDSDPNTVQWFADSDYDSTSTEIQQALWNAGLSRDINVEIVPGPTDTDAKQQQLQRWLDADLEKPDLLMVDSGWAIPFIVREQLLNLTKSEAFPDSLRKRIEDHYFEASVQTAKHPQTGDLFGMPLYPDFATMIYRKDLIKQAGYSPDREGWANQGITWKKFAQAVNDAMGQSDVQYGYTFQASTYEGLSCCDFNEFITSWGGAYFGGRDTLFGPVGNRPVTVNEQPVVDSIRMIRTFINGSQDKHALEGYAGPISPRAVLSWIEDTSLAPFINGEAIANRNWPYAITQSADAHNAENIGVMPIPYGTTEQQSKYSGIGGPTAALGGWHMAINPNTAKLDQSIQVLEAMATKQFKIDHFKILSRIPPEPRILQSRAARQVPTIGNYVKQLRTAGENAIPRPVTVVWPQQSTKISQIVNASYRGGVAPEQAMNTLQSQLTEIENYNK